VRLRLVIRRTVRRGTRRIHRTIGLGEIGTTLAPGRRRIVTVRLDATAHRMLARRSPLSPRLVLEHTVGGRLRTVAFRTVTLRVAPRPVPSAPTGR
jgi:hypothetical protein